MKAKVFLRKKTQNRLQYFHPWIYENEIGILEGEAKPGEIVEVFTHIGSYIGLGFFNPHASIRIKMFVFKEKLDFDENFLKEKINKAKLLREQIAYKNNYRIFNAEGDGIPGLIIDLFPKVIVFQTLSIGIDYYKETLIKVLKELFPKHIIYEQNDVFVRNLEGLRLHRKLHNNNENIENLQYIIDNIPFKLILDKHEKTGIDWEIEPMWNLIKAFIPKSKVLCLFSGFGEFPILANKNQASSIQAVDYNAYSLEISKENAEAQKCKNINWIQQNVFDYLKTEQYASTMWDIIILNPPSFIHKKNQLHKAFTAYKELLIRCINQLKKNGKLLIAFPNYYYSETWITTLMQDLIKDKKRNIQVIKKITGRADHPISAALPQEEKFHAYLWQVN